MALKREAYLALEDIVGPEYITEEPAVLDGYCFYLGERSYFWRQIWSKARKQ